MASQALYLRWRPLRFEEVVGQEHIVYTLRNALVANRVAHAYLFSGPRGTGKTTTARLLAKAVNCLDADPTQHPCNVCHNCVAVNEGRFLDLIEIDAASHTGVDDVRDLRDKIAFAPNEGRYKVYIIDEVHRFSGAAFDALLKTIEEPPEHAIFVLATTEIHKVPPTILSRCQRFDFRRIPLDHIVGHLSEMIAAEGLSAEPAALELIARQATGSLRDAISLLDQLLSTPEETLTLELAQAILGTVADETVQVLTDSILTGDTATGLDMINNVLDQGADARQFARQMTEYLRLVMLVQTGGVTLVETIAPPEALDVIAAQAEALPRRALLSAVSAFNEASTDQRSGWQPQLPLEMAFVESVEAFHAAPEPAPVARQQPQQPRQPRQAAPPAPAEPAPRPTPAQPEPPPPPDPGAPTLAEVNERWAEALKIIKERDHQANALLNSGTLYDIERSLIVFQVPSDLLRDKIEADHTRAVIEQVLSEVYGYPLGIRCIVGGGQQTGRSREMADLLASDSVVASAVHDMGGEVTEIEEYEE